MDTLARFKGLFLVTLSLAAGAAWAQTTPNRFTTVIGDVRVMGVDGQTRPIERGAELREGETIVTGANALAQLRMADGGQMSVRAETEIKLDRFSYMGKDDRQATFLASIVKGGLRVITGLMVQQNRAGYAIRTPSATMGVRGTHFEVVHVLQPQPELLAGTYNRVYEGVTSIENRGGASLLVNRDQTAFIGLGGNMAPQIVVPPHVLFGRPTPVPGVPPRPADKAGGQSTPPSAGAPQRGSTQTRTLVNPMETRTLQPAPTLTSPTTTTISPTLDTSTTTIKLDTSTTLTAPTTTTTTTIKTDSILTSPTTTTIQTAPLTTTIQTAPTTTTTTTTTTTNILTSPTTTTISPTLTSPTIK
jgi:hypothetical protein